MKNVLGSEIFIVKIQHNTKIINLMWLAKRNEYFFKNRLNKNKTLDGVDVAVWY